MAMNFGKCWKDGQFITRDKGLNKVLCQMRGDLLNVRPLLCMWAPMHLDWHEKAEPLFVMPAGKNPGNFKVSMTFVAIRAGPRVRC